MRKRVPVPWHHSTRDTWWVFVGLLAACAINSLGRGDWVWFAGDVVLLAYWLRQAGREAA